MTELDHSLAPQSSHSPPPLPSILPPHSVGSKQRDPESTRGFTLLELLIVVGIIGLLMVLIAPAFTTIKGGTDVPAPHTRSKAHSIPLARTRKRTTLTHGWVLRVRLEQQSRDRFK